MLSKRILKSLTLYVLYMGLLITSFLLRKYLSEWQGLSEVCLLAALIISTSWRFALVEYSRSRYQSTIRAVALILLLVEFVFSLSFLLDPYMSVFPDFIGSTILWSMLLQAGIAGILTFHLQKILYNRSQWFLFLEVLMPIWGMLTLAESIEQFEQESNE